MVEVEEYEETVKEKRELPADPNAAADGDTAMKTDGEGDAMKTDGDAAEGGDAMKTDGDADVPMTDGEQKPAEEKKEEAKKEPEKKFEWVDVVKKKKRTKRTDLKVSTVGAPGMAEAR